MSKWQLAAAVISIFGASCGLQVQPPHGKVSAEASADPVEILSISATTYSGAPDDALADACNEWHLSPAQAAEFFEQATRYPAPPYSGFYFLPCSIDGELLEGGTRWEFSIGGAGTAVWRAGNRRVHWGCSAPGCAPLLLLPTDNMAP